MKRFTPSEKQWKKKYKKYTLNDKMKVLKVLKLEDGNYTKTEKILGISKSSIWR